MRGDICTTCCGTEREVTVDCPWDCAYLQEARKHERSAPVNPDGFPNQDIRVSEEFLRDHEPLLVATARGLMQAAFDTTGAVDLDVREALDALIRTYRTLQSGVYYETRPDNPLANTALTLDASGARSAALPATWPRAWFRPGGTAGFWQ